MMPHEACGEVLRNPCALTLRDEPLAGAVEHGASELWVTSAQGQKTFEFRIVYRGGSYDALIGAANTKMNGEL